MLPNATRFFAGRWAKEKGEMRPKTQRYILVLLICCIVGLFTLAVFIHRARTTAPEIFRSVVADPIPKSVKNIRVHRHHDSGGFYHPIRTYTYVLRFDISQEDLSHIIASGRYTELGSLEYLEGGICYAIPHGPYSDITLHMTKQEEASFDVWQWKDFKSSIEEDYSACWYRGHFLLYNEQLRRAYFIEFEQRGDGAGERSVTNAENRKWAESMKRQMDQLRQWREDPNVQRALERLHERRKDVNALEGIQRE